MSEKYIKAIVTFKVAKPKSILIVYDDEEHWVPRSLISWACDQQVDNLRNGEEFELAVIDWKANNMGF